MNHLLIIGAGGLGKMIKEVALSLGYERVLFLDDAAKGTDVIGKCCDYLAMRDKYDTAVAALGDNEMRLYWTEKLMEADYTVPALIHPSAVVSPSASIAAGSFILQRAVINTNSCIEHAVLVNAGAIVDHNSYIERGAHVGLGGIVKSDCHVAPVKKVEAGEVVFPTRRKIDGVTKRTLEDALYAFGFGTTCSYVKPFGAGHINDTYAVYMETGHGDELLYVLQRVNTYVFNNPAAVMDNIFGITEYMRTVIRREGGDPDRETLSYIKTKHGRNYFEDEEGQPWRCYNFIPDSLCYQEVERPEQFYQSAYSFGHFLKQLGDYPVDSLTETIPDFHNTAKRLDTFELVYRRDIQNRAASCQAECDFVLKRKDDCKLLVKQQEAGILPLRVTHNDTKLNNILFDAETGKGLCVIDLDTIMPGLAANDFGDSIRFGATTAAEDEKNLDLVHFDMELYELYVKGYLEATKDVLTAAELESLPWGARLITLECGMRFLTDYLQGDTYFKTDYPEHNLVRARTQFRLVDEMEQQFEKMQQIVKDYC